MPTHTPEQTAEIVRRVNAKGWKGRKKKVETKVERAKRQEAEMQADLDASRYHGTQPGKGRKGYKKQRRR